MGNASWSSFSQRGSFTIIPFPPGPARQISVFMLLPNLSQNHSHLSLNFPSVLMWKSVHRTQSLHDRELQSKTSNSKSDDRRPSNLLVPTMVDSIYPPSHPIASHQRRRPRSPRLQIFNHHLCLKLPCVREVKIKNSGVVFKLQLLLSINLFFSG